MALEEKFQIFAKKKKFKIIKDLGRGGYGIVKEIEIQGKKYAAKLIKKEEKSEIDYIREFRGPNIVKINSIFTNKGINNEVYYLIIMEKSGLENLRILAKAFHSNLLNLIFQNPFEVLGDNLLRFFIKQILNGMELLNRNSFCHFDIKPDNILIFRNMILKITDFGLLTRTNDKEKKEDNKIRIPGGTVGYLTPEFYSNKEHLLPIDAAIKQDYFALGATLYYLKYGKQMLNYKPYEEFTKNSDVITDLLQKAIDNIKSEKSTDQGFVEFLISLIQYIPEERPNFESIYRNEWLNKNREEILRISEINEMDEKKLLIELDKSDYLIEKRKFIYKNNNNDDNKVNETKKKPNKIRYHKFIFKYNNNCY